jgi:hypothetical protein
MPERLPAGTLEVVPEAIGDLVELLDYRHRRS